MCAEGVLKRGSMRGKVPTLRMPGATDATNSTLLSVYVVDQSVTAVPLA
jgi:hypothetical protein